MKAGYVYPSACRLLLHHTATATSTATVAAAAAATITAVAAI